MKRFLALIATIVTIAAPMSAQADNPPPQPTAERTEADANCVWGSNIGGTPKINTYTKQYTSASDWRFENGPPGDCNLGVVYMPNMLTGTGSSLVALSAVDANNFTKRADCIDGADPACDPSKWVILRQQSTFYKCVNSNDLNCIFDFSATDENGNKVATKYLRSFPDDKVKPGFDGPIVKYPPGGNPSIWTINTPSGEVKIVVFGLTASGWDSRGGKWEARPGTQFQLFLLPVKESPVPTDPRGFNCFAADQATCLTVDPSLPGGYTFKVSLNLADNATLFLNGRLDKPVVYTEPIQGGHRFTIEAAPSPALSVAQWVPKSIIPRNVIDNAFKNVGGTWFSETLKLSNSEFRLGGEQGSVEFFNAVLPYIGDRVSFVQYLWSVANNPTSDNYNQSCRAEAKGQVLGIVSTNATAYRGDPPTYNRSTASLDYEVSAPHYMPDGKTESVGRYAINMNAKFLQCILGVSKVPATATIGLTYANGQASISTLAVKQDKDWLRVQLDNFHFSSPKISIKFNNAGSTTGTSTSTTKSTNKTINCVKGKTVKKISGANPKCPAGFTLKK